MGCDEHWGDDLETFSHAKARPLSVDYATAQLKERWAAAHQVQALILLTRIRVYTERTAAISAFSDISRTEDIQLTPTFLEIEAGLSSLLTLQRELELTRASLDAWKQSCSSRDFFDNSELSKISLPSPTFVGADPNYQISVSTDLITSIVNGLGELWGNISGASAEKQNRKAKAAIEHFNQTKIQGDDLFELSESICSAEAERFSEAKERFTHSLALLESAIGGLRASLQAARNYVTARLSPLDLEQFLRADGVIALLLEQQKSREQADLGMDLQTMRASVNRLSRTIERSGTCAEKLARLEDLASVLLTDLAQIGFIAETHEPAPSLLAALTSAKAEYQAKLASTRARIAKFSQASPSTMEGCQ